MKALLFPGQGAQFKGMGKDLFPFYPEWVQKASEIVSYSIEALCLEDTEGKLNRTEYTQPALYVVNALRWEKEKAENTEEISFFAGHSLGEYNALLAAGAFDFETGLKLVKKRGELMAQAKDGGMLAVLGVKIDSVEAILQQHALNDLGVANYNTPTQTILSGPKPRITELVEILNKERVTCMPLNVSAAFHSRYMQSAQAEFSGYLDNFSFLPLRTPVIANCTARPYRADKVADLLVDQITGSVRWSESICYLMGKGVNDFREMGEKPILTKMVGEIQKTEAPLVVAEDISETVDGNGVGLSADFKHLDKSRGTGGSSHTKSVSIVEEASSPFKNKKDRAEDLGSQAFKQEYGIKYAYLTGAMYRGIASKELVVAMGKANLMGFLGTAGMSLDEIRSSIDFIQRELTQGQAYGMNLICNLTDPSMELKTVEVYFEKGIKRIEASAFMQMTPALVLYRLRGLCRDDGGEIHCENQIMGKVSRPEVASAFMSPAPEHIVKRLLSENRISVEQAEMAKEVPMAYDICVEADSGGHTDQGIATVLLPAIQSLRKNILQQHAYTKPIHIGLAGGIGTPEAVAAAFVMGADFVLTGSINQCTVESGMSDTVKDLLQEINVQDTDYAPAGDMFEIGARVQVLKKGVFFSARANKLFMLYSHYDSLDEIPEKIQKQLQETYFKRSFESIWEETKAYFQRKGRQKDIDKAERNPKHKMALIFRWYFSYTTRLTFEGDKANRVNFQVHTGPALGAFNQWVKGTDLERWQNRHVHEIGEKLMQSAADLLHEKLFSLVSGQAVRHEKATQALAQSNDLLCLK